MKKLFISQPMGNKKPEEILADRAEAINVATMILQDDVEVLDSYYGSIGEHPPLYYLGESLKLMSSADIVYFSPGWSNARGCKIEHTCAEEYGIQIIEKNN